MEQTALALRHVDAGDTGGGDLLEVEIAEVTFHRWKRKVGDLGLSELRELRQLRDENRRLKRVVADLTTRPTDPAGVAAKTILTLAQRRSWVMWVQEAFRVSTRCACQATGVWRSPLTER